MKGKRLKIMSWSTKYFYVADVLYLVTGPLTKLTEYNCSLISLLWLFLWTGVTHVKLIIDQKQKAPGHRWLQVKWETCPSSSHYLSHTSQVFETVSTFDSIFRLTPVWVWHFTFSSGCLTFSHSHRLRGRGWMLIIIETVLGFQDFKGCN